MASNWSTFYFEHVSSRNSSMSMEFNKAINRLKNSYRRISSGSLLTDVDYTLEENRYAYLYLYGGCHSAMVESMMTSYINSDKVMYRLLTNGCMKICSLGGGAGCDVLGLRESIRKDDFSINCESVVVDKYCHWKNEFDNLTSKKTYPGDRSSFVYADLLDPLARDLCKETLRSADVICMVKFVSVLLFQNAEECKKMIKFIFEEMRTGALLIFIDNAGGGFMETMIQIASTIPRLKLNYEKKAFPFKMNENDQTLKYFQYLLYTSTPLTSCKISMAVWVKG